MNILITGGCGHIGTNIILEALKRGHKVVSMDNLHREGVIDNLKFLQKQKGFEFVWGDVRNVDDFKKIPTNITSIIHLASNPGIPTSIQNPTYDFDVNARGTLNALEFARFCKNIPFIYASTNKVYSDIINTFDKIETNTRYQWMHKNEILPDGFDGKSISDKFPIEGFGKYGHSPYGISKLTGELYATEYHCQYNLPVVINRMSCIFGLFQKGAVEQGWVSHFLRSCIEGKQIEIYGTGKQVRDVLDARDLAQLYLNELEQVSLCNGNIFTVGGGPTHTVSLLETITEIVKQTGKQINYSIKPQRSSDQNIYISNISRLKMTLDWEPTIPFSQTITDMIKEYSYE